MKVYIIKTNTSQIYYIRSLNLATFSGYWFERIFSVRFYQVRIVYAEFDDPSVEPSSGTTK